MAYDSFTEVPHDLLVLIGELVPFYSVDQIDDDWFARTTRVLRDDDTILAWGYGEQTFALERAVHMLGWRVGAAARLLQQFGNWCERDELQFAVNVVEHYRLRRLKA